MSKVLDCRRVVSIFATVVAAIAALAVRPGEATPDDVAIAQICETAAVVAARESGVPIDVLRAISLTETGRKRAEGFLPWPWTVNMEGAGKWFDDLQTARSYVDRHFARGARSFDVGCFQINYRWHGQAFASIDEMFEPLANARYAAKFLSELHAELGDWSKAAGAYHSRTPKYARKYRARFNRIRDRLSDLEPYAITVAQPEKPPAGLDIIARINRYPLLQSGRPSSAGSLVPLGTVASARFIDFPAPVPIVDMR